MFGQSVLCKTREMDWCGDARTFNPAAVASGPTFGRPSRGRLRRFIEFFLSILFLLPRDYDMGPTLNDILFHAYRHFHFKDTVRMFMIIYSVY